MKFLDKTGLDTLWAKIKKCMPFYTEIALSGNANGWCKVATIRCGSQYMNTPIIINILSRGFSSSRVELCMTSTDTFKPGLAYFKHAIQCFNGQAETFNVGYTYEDVDDVRTYTLWKKKNERYGSISVNCECRANYEKYVTFEKAIVYEEPEGIVYADKVYDTISVLPIANGGTGVTSEQAIVDGPIQNGIGQGDSDVTDNTELITTHASTGYTTTNKRLYRRKATYLWNYIKGKLTSVSGVNISGNAATANAISAWNISYHRPTDSTGSTADGKQWCRLGTLTDTAVAAGAQWFGIGVLFNVYSNPYGPQRTHFGCYEFLLRVNNSARAQGGPDYSLKTSGEMTIQKLYGPDAPAAANGRSGIDFRIVRSDTKVELFIKNSVWDSSLYIERFRQIDGSGSYGTWEWAIANGLYTEEEFTEYCSDKTVKYLTKKYEFKANVADSTLWSNFYNGYKEVAFASSVTYETFCADRMTANSFAYSVFGDTLDTTDKTINAIGRLNLSSASAIKTGIGIANDYPMFHVVATRQVGYVDIAAGSKIVRFSFGRYGTLSDKVTVSTGDTKVTQTADNSSTGTGFEVLFSATGDNSTRTEGAKKSNKLTFQPSTGTLTATKFSGPLDGNASTSTKATQDSDGNAINATYFKANAGTTTLQSGTAVKVGTQNGADVKLQLPTIPAAANNGALKIGLNGGTASSKFTANQSGDSTLTFASGTTAGTIKVDGTEVAVAGWSGKQDDLKYQLVEYGATYSDVSAIISNGKTPVVRVGDSQNGYKMYTWDGLTRTTSEGYTEYYFVLPVADATLIRFSYVCLNQLNSTWSSGEYSWQGGESSQDALFHTETLNVTDSVTRFLKITFSGRVGRCIAVIAIAGGSGTTNAVFRLSWTFVSVSEGIINVGNEMISCSNLAKPPLVYHDGSSFYIGIYDSLNRSATVAVMMSSEDASKVSYSTVTRGTATSSDKTAVPITWHPVMSETIDEIHAAVYDDTSGATVATTFNELKSWYSTRPNIILVERHQPSGSVSTTQKVYMLTDTSYSQGNPTKFVFTRVRHDTDYMGDVETMTCTSSGWAYSISNTKNATYAVSAGSADFATKASYYPDPDTPETPISIRESMEARLVADTPKVRVPPEQASGERKTYLTSCLFTRLPDASAYSNHIGTNVNYINLNDFMSWNTPSDLVKAGQVFAIWNTRSEDVRLYLGSSTSNDYMTVKAGRIGFVGTWDGMNFKLMTQ